MKDIVIIANFCRDFSEQDNGRFMYLCRELSANTDNKVEIITSDYSHSEKKHKDILKHDWPFKITFVHEPGYKKNISLKRFYSHYVWGINVYKYLSKRQKPDVIYCAVPSLTAAKYAADYCEKNKIKFVVDIQDLWPEAFRMVFNPPMISDVVYWPFYRIANYIYSKASFIIGVSEAYVKRAIMVNRKADTHVAYLGTKLEAFDYARNEKPFLKKRDNEILVAYCGSLSKSYDIPNLIKAFRVTSICSDNVRLIIMGEGPYKEYFMSLASDLKDRVIFTGRLPYNEMCATLSRCDIAVNPIVHDSAASIINKHGDYAASGLPVINSQSCQEYRDLVDRYNMGINCNAEDDRDMARALLWLIKNPKERKIMGNNARKCAEEKFDRKFTYKTIIAYIERE